MTSVVTVTLVVMTLGNDVASGVVTEDTEIDFEDAEDSEATTADLQPGVVAKLEFDEEDRHPREDRDLPQLTQPQQLPQGWTRGESPP